MDMRIYIPTYGRVNRQHTWNNLPPRLRERTTTVVREKEAQHFRDRDTLVISNVFAGMGRVRDQIIADAAARNCTAIMADDDLTFAMRRKDDNTKFADASLDDVELAFWTLHEMLMSRPDIGMVSMSPREGANRVTERYIWNTRALRVLGYNPKILLREKILFCDMDFMEDFHVQLALLTRGYESYHLNWMVHNQPGSNTEGGCSETRTLERHELAVRALAERYPDFVTVVKKQTKTSWNGAERYDVRIAWKKARYAGTSYRASAVLDSGAGTDTVQEGAATAETLD